MSRHIAALIWAASNSLTSPGPVTPLALHYLVALLQQTLAFAVLAFLLLLGVGAFVVRSVICHAGLPRVM